MMEHDNVRKGMYMMAQVNLSMRKKLMDLEKRLVVAKGEGEGVGWTGSLGVSGCKLLYSEWTGNEVLL